MTHLAVMVQVNNGFSRYVFFMGLRCARLGCKDLAAASLLFKADRSEVALIDLAEATAGIPLCGRHARTRTAPIGWTMVDYRTPAQAELWAIDAPPPSEIGPTDRPPLRRADDEEFRWGRDARVTDEIPADLDAESPLLARAFRTAST